MVKVLYDHQAFDSQTYGGVTNGAVQLISNLPSYIDKTIAVKRTGNVHLLSSKISKAKPLLCTRDSFIMDKYFKGKYRLFDKLASKCIFLRPWDLNKAYSIQLLTEGNYDVFHPTYFYWYFLDYIGSKPFILTIHDLTPERFFENKDDLQIKARELLIDKAAHITVNSEFTKDEVMDYYKVPSSKISVIYRGAPSEIAYSKEKIFSFDYLLYVGSRTTSYKNFLPMLRNIRSFLLSHENIKLVCTGNEFDLDEAKVISELNLSDKVITRFCSPEELMNLYSNAICFIYPSLNEGFGLPILEAYSADCPVFLNNCSCFPEIALDAAVYFNLKDEYGDLCDRLDEFLKASLQERHQLVIKQRNRLSFFSWKKSAEKLAQVYEQVASV